MPGIWEHFLAIEVRYQEWPCALCSWSLLVALICDELEQPGRSHNLWCWLQTALAVTLRDWSLVRVGAGNRLFWWATGDNRAAPLPHHRP